MRYCWNDLSKPWLVKLSSTLIRTFVTAYHGRTIKITSRHGYNKPGTFFWSSWQFYFLVISLIPTIKGIGVATHQLHQWSPPSPIKSFWDSIDVVRIMKLTSDLLRTVDWKVWCDDYLQQVGYVPNGRSVVQWKDMVTIFGRKHYDRVWKTKLWSSQVEQPRFEPLHRSGLFPGGAIDRRAINSFEFGDVGLIGVEFGDVCLNWSWWFIEWRWWDSMWILQCQIMDYHQVELAALEVCRNDLNNTWIGSNCGQFAGTD